MDIFFYFYLRIQSMDNFKRSFSIKMRMNIPKCSFINRKKAKIP